jgi:POT family proton-dependent oligopeptide transporter
MNRRSNDNPNPYEPSAVESPAAPRAEVSDPAANPANQPKGHPPAFWFIFWGEFAERASYYGMRAILPLYLTTALHFTDTQAGPIYFWFKIAVYFLPLLGGFVADRYFGKYWTIVGFSVPYVLGHFILGIETTSALVIALSLLALGSGVTKPNISTLLGLTYDQRRPGQEQLLSAAFRWFYFSVNVGALLSTFALPIIRDHFSFRIAFQFPAWLMVAALIAFASGKRFYAVETPGRVSTTPDQRRARWQTLSALFGFFAVMVFFWFGYEHNDSLWVFFLRDYVNRRIPGTNWTVAPDQVQFLNPLFVLIFVPLLTWLFSRTDPDNRIFTAYRRILMGFVATAVAIGIMSLAGFATAGGQVKISVAWVALAYVALTFGEVLVYATGLELSYTAAPKSMKSFISACFLVTVAVANFLNTWYSPLYGGSLTDKIEERGPLSPGMFFLVPTLTTLLAAVIFYFIGRRLSEKRSAD